MPQMGLGIEQSASIIELSLELTFLWEECGGGGAMCGHRKETGLTRAIKPPISVSRIFSLPEVL